ncbi:MAG: DUF1570 domain-containing protein [Phycisphaerales bacterium]|nr:DUF1570 domain-containing protein [Phycisphaerales bacterium]
MALSGCGPEPTRIDPTRSTLLRSSPENPLSTGEFEAQRSGRHGERIEPWNMGAIRGEVMETESYRIRSTLRDPYLRDVLPDFMEHALNHYRSGLAPLPAPTRMLETWVFGSRDEWAAYTKSRLMGDAAPYLSLGRGGYTTQSHAILYDIGPVDTLSIASHEGWHQYSQTVLRDTLPSWLEEGIACFMEGYRIRSQEESALFIPWRNLERFGELRGAVRREKLIPLESLISRQPQDFLAESRDGLLTYYAQVWALVHYLNEGEQGKYRTGLTRILADAEAGTLGKKLASESSRSGVSVDRAAVSVYFSHDFPAFTSGYEEFVRRATVRGAGDAVWHGRSPLAEESLK